jgi:diacylglycerol kinase (ATP)
MTALHVLGNPNAAAGRRSSSLDDVVASIRALGHDVVRHDARSRDEAASIAHEAVAAGASRLVVVGGDGLVHLAVQALACRDVTLGVVPLGTGNDYARALGVAGLDTAAAVERALGPATALDAMRTTHGWVASVASVGFSAAVNARANRLRRPRGAGRYTVATVLELPRLSPLAVTLDVDGTELEVETAFVVVANTAYFGGGMAICPDASPCDGELDIAVVDAVSRHTLLRVFPRVYRGTHVTHPACRMLRGRRVRIAATDAELWGDGERVGAAPVDIDVVPGALRVAGARTTTPVVGVAASRPVP